MALANCRADWQPVFFMFQEHWIKVDPEDLLIDVSDNGDGSVCLFLMMAN